MPPTSTLTPTPVLLLRYLRSTTPIPLLLPPPPLTLTLLLTRVLLFVICHGDLMRGPCSTSKADVSLAASHQGEGEEEKNRGTYSSSRFEIDSAAISTRVAPLVFQKRVLIA